MKTQVLILISIVCGFFSSAALAKGGVTYEMNQGIGYIIQDDLWQGSLVVGYFSKRFDTDNSALNYKLTVRRDLTKVESIPVTLGVSFAQTRPAKNMEYTANTLAFPVGIRHQLASNLQLDVFVNILSNEERFVYDTATQKQAYNDNTTGTHYLSSGGFSVSLLW